MDSKSLARTPSLGTSELYKDDKNSQFKRGHIRRSSYESAQIQLNFARRTNRTNEHKYSNEKPECSKSSCSAQTVDSGFEGSNVDCESKLEYSDRQSDFSDVDDRSFEEPQTSKSKSNSHSGAKFFFNFSKTLFSRKNKGATNAKICSNTPVMHTTGLILHDRPSNLPAKSQHEAAHHHQLHLKMIEQTKKKEIKAEKERKMQQIEQKRLEEQVAVACRVWNEQILPNWSLMHESPQCRELWWQGLPPKIRGKVWSLAIDNNCRITPELYEIYKSQAESRLNGHISTDDTEDSLYLIHLDVSRTFPALGIFQKGGPYYDHLLLLLATFACYRPDIGYVQSMSFLAALLLLQLDSYPAFVAFSNLLDKPLQKAFFGLMQPAMTEYFIAYDHYFLQELPELHKHFDVLDVRPDLYLIEWLYTLFAKSLPLDITCRIWDVYTRDGEEFLFQTAIGILRQSEQLLMGMNFEECVEHLSKLPNITNSSELFKHIEPSMRLNDKSKKSFLQILKEVHQKINPEGTSDISKLCCNVKTLKMSKSLNDFIGDLLIDETETTRNIT